jgi:uncharacterized protein (DUF2249 family)
MYKKPEHWQSIDHPDGHPRLLRRAGSGNPNGAKQRHDNVQLDRSNCSLEMRTGDDPSTATYKCSGCSTEVVGFGRWRNHMKRAKKSFGSGDRGGNVVAASFEAPTAMQRLSAHQEHTQATFDDLATDMPAAQPVLAAPPIKKQKAEAHAASVEEAPHAGKAVWRLTSKEKKAKAALEAESRSDEGMAAGEAVASVEEAPHAGKAVWRLASKEKKAKAALEAETRADEGMAAGEAIKQQPSAPHGKRWLGEAGKSGKRQRKFY